MGYNPQESLENTLNTMGTLLGVHPIVPWILGSKTLIQTFCPRHHVAKTMTTRIDTWASINTAQDII